MCDKDTIEKIKKEISKLKSDFHTLKQKIPENGIKNEFEKVWEQIKRQMEIIDGLASQKEIDFSNLSKLHDILQDVTVLESNFETLKDEFKNVKFNLFEISQQQKDIKRNQEEWAKLQVNVDSTITELKKSIYSIEKARQERKDERKREEEKRQSERKTDFWKNLGTIFGSLLTGLTLITLIFKFFVVDKNQAQRDLINQRDSTQAIIINQILEDNKEIKNDIKELIGKKK